MESMCITQLIIEFKIKYPSNISSIDMIKQRLKIRPQQLTKQLNVIECLL